MEVKSEEERAAFAHEEDLDSDLQFDSAVTELFTGSDIESVRTIHAVSWLFHPTLACHVAENASTKITDADSLVVRPVKCSAELS